jgi:predicted enzyme related to lactoylglutathione lyase
MGNPFVHIELNTDDVAKAKKFYKSLFQWKLGEMAPGYTGINVGKGTGGGMQKKPMPAAPTLWLPYVEVDDVKKTVQKAQKLGAIVQVEYMAVGDMGAIGVFVDPTGAPIGVWARAKPAKRSAAKKAKKAAKKAKKSRR